MPGRAAPGRGTPAAPDGENESKRQAIVEAAAEIFHRKGYHAASIQDIAEEVGMLKGSLYYYISSKNDLLLQIITQVHEQAFRDLTEIIESELTAPERLRRFILHHTMYCTSHLTFMGVYLHEYKALEGSARTRVITMRDTYEALVCEIIVAGQAEGSFRTDANPKLTVKFVLGMINWLYHWYSPKGPLTPQQIGDAVGDLVLHGLSPSQGPAPKTRPAPG